eukprot:4231319-Alexandrium_andersonii.AAC.1
MMSGRHFAGSPLQLHVAAARGDRGGSAEETGGKSPGIQLPSRRCSLGGPDVDGRWIRCSSAC